MNECPVCKGNLGVIWESRDEQNTWFAGLYRCFHCRLIRMSGRVVDGEDLCVSWHPSCPKHGTDAVIASDPDNDKFYCVRCGRKIEVRKGNIIVTW